MIDDTNNNDNNDTNRNNKNNNESNKSNNNKAAHIQKDRACVQYEQKINTF